MKAPPPPSLPTVTGRRGGPAPVPAAAGRDRRWTPAAAAAAAAAPAEAPSYDSPAFGRRRLGGEKSPRLVFVTTESGEAGAAIDRALKKR